MKTKKLKSKISKNKKKNPYPIIFVNLAAKVDRKTKKIIFNSWEFYGEPKMTVEEYAQPIYEMMNNSAKGVRQFYLAKKKPRRRIKF